MQSKRPSIKWRGESIATFRLEKRRQIVPFLISGGFFFLWYTALFHSFKSEEGIPLWESFWETLKAEPPIAILLLAPSVPIVMLLRDLLIGDRLVFDKNQRLILKNKKQVMGFDQVQALVIRLQTQTPTHHGADLSLQGKDGRFVFLTRCGGYESCYALAQELAVIIHAEVKTLQAER
ncbi:hypothetical protein JW992_04465 [candidate division KSB1 bacterium]|nr:hypothetical protein [candidate division KSB1 bacterium]